jgi:putative NADPH-quinone reductase
MPRNITIIQGNPDPQGIHFGHALAEAYAKGACAGGHQVRTLNVAALEIPPLHSRTEWEQPPSEAIHAAQDSIAWADHLLILYPLWLGDLPAVLKGFWEQVLRPGFAFGEVDGKHRRLLTGKTAHIVVTMGMPGFVYRWFYRAHSLKSFERNVLAFVGIKPIRSTVIGTVEGSSEDRMAWLEKMEEWGREAG